MLSISRSLFVAALMAAALPPLAVHAVTLDVAQQAADQVSALPWPGPGASEFEHWTYNTAMLTAGDCWHAAAPGQEYPAALAKFGPTRAGSYTLPSEQEREQVCSSIAKQGIAPVCTHGTFWVENAPPAPLLPPYYLAFRGDPNAVQVRGGLYCYLNADRAQKQMFATPLAVKWSTPVRPQQVNLPSGRHTLNMGTVVLTAPDAPGLSGGPYEEPRNIVQY